LTFSTKRGDTSVTKKKNKETIMQDVQELTRQQLFREYSQLATEHSHALERIEEMNTQLEQLDTILSKHPDALDAYLSLILPSEKTSSTRNTPTLARFSYSSAINELAEIYLLCFPYYIRRAAALYIMPST
jgi:hypothetical protein